MEMLYWCQCCNHTSKLMGWVRDVFQHCAHNWSRNAMLRELSYVIKVFHLSEDPKGWQLFRRCSDLVERLHMGSADESMCSGMLLQVIQEISNQENEDEALERVLLDANAEPIKLSYTFLKSITNDFSRVIGSGGFGVVYMGVLRQKKVAVKMFFERIGFPDKQFEESGSRRRGSMGAAGEWCGSGETAWWAVVAATDYIGGSGLVVVTMVGSELVAAAGRRVPGEILHGLLCRQRRRLVRRSPVEDVVKAPSSLRWWFLRVKTLPRSGRRRRHILVSCASWRRRLGVHPSCSASLISLAWFGGDRPRIASVVSVLDSILWVKWWN